MATTCNNLGSERTMFDFVCEEFRLLLPRLDSVGEEFRFLLPRLDHFMVRWFCSIATWVLVCVRYCAEVLTDVLEVWRLWRYKREFVRSSKFPKGVEGGAPSVLDLSEGTKSSFSASDIFELVAEDIKTLNNNLMSVVGSDNPILKSAADHILRAGGKRLRPALVFLVSRATAGIAGLKDLTQGQRMLAKVVEMVHTASLIHDDIIDESDMRRGKKTVHQLYGTRNAMLAGDYMFARSTLLLAKLENFKVSKLLNEVIADLVNGEINQAASLFDCDVKLDEYLLKSYNKTASLIAASTKGAVVLSGGLSSGICDHMYEYGKNWGLSFQVVDDILDFTQTTQGLGKPAGSDMLKGILTAPVIFALEKEAKLRAIIESKFEETGSLDEAVEIVKNSGGIDRARDLAREIGDKAVWNLNCLPPSLFRVALERLVDYNLERIK